MKKRSIYVLITCLSMYAFMACSSGEGEKSTLDNSSVGTIEVSGDSELDDTTTMEGTLGENGTSEAEEVSESKAQETSEEATTSKEQEVIKETTTTKEQEVIKETTTKKENSSKKEESTTKKYTYIPEETTTKNNSTGNNSGVKGYNPLDAFSGAMANIPARPIAPTTKERWAKVPDFTNSTLSEREMAIKVAECILAKSMTDFEKVLSIHDWITYNVDYDHIGLKNNEANYYPKEAFKEKYVVCNGYALTFSLLCDVSGIEHSVIYGQAGVYHAWNQVKVDGVWYNVDATWDDESGNSYYQKDFNDHSKNCYKYFLISEKTIIEGKHRAEYAFVGSMHTCSVDYDRNTIELAAAMNNYPTKPQYVTSIQDFADIVAKEPDAENGVYRFTYKFEAEDIKDATPQTCLDIMNEMLKSYDTFVKCTSLGPIRESTDVYNIVVEVTDLKVEYITCEEDIYKYIEKYRDAGKTEVLIAYKDSMYDWQSNDIEHLLKEMEYPVTFERKTMNTVYNVAKLSFMCKAQWESIPAVTNKEEFENVARDFLSKGILEFTVRYESYDQRYVEFDDLHYYLRDYRSEVMYNHLDYMNRWEHWNYVTVIYEYRENKFQ